jgi:hypothetical protein
LSNLRVAFASAYLAMAILALTLSGLEEVLHASQ